MPTPARKVAAILDDSPDLAVLAAMARLTAELQRVYVEAVPAELLEASRVGWARAGVLSIAARNAAVAAKLRQLSPRILGRFRRQGHEFNAMRVEVQVAANRVAARKLEVKSLSDQALMSIRSAEMNAADSPLRLVLARIGRAQRGHKTRSRT